MPIKRSRTWIVERTSWFGDTEHVATFHTAKEAQAFAAKCRQQSKAVDDPADKIVYTVISEIWEREN